MKGQPIFSIEFVFNENPNGHQDLLFKLPRQHFKHLLDAYYLVIDWHYFPDAYVDLRKASKILILLMEKWIIALKLMNDDETALLPVGFFDQEYHGMVVQKNTTGLKIFYAADGHFHNESGYYPRNFKFYTGEPEDFLVSNWTVESVIIMAEGFYEVSIVDFIENIEDQIAAIKDQMVNY